MFEIQKSKIGLTDLLKLSGRIDSINSRTVHETISNEVSYDDPHLVVDMEDVEYMSAAGLRILKSLYDASGHVRIANPSKRVREVLQITGLDAVYDVFDSRMAAVHAVQPVTNAHTHLELGVLADNRPPITGKPFVKWILDDVDTPLRQSSKLTDRKFTEVVNKSIQAMIDAGVTMVGDITSNGTSIEPLLKSGLHGVVYVEYMGTNPAQAQSKLTQVGMMIEKHRHHIQRGMHLGISFHSPYSLHPEHWKLGLAYAREHNLPICIHVAESPAEYEFMSKGTGDIADAYYTRMPKLTTPMKSPVQFLSDIGALELKPLLIHCVQVDDSDIKRIKDSGSTVVHCPRSNLRLQCGRMPLEKFLDSDIPVILGTDSLASSPSLNIFDEVEIATALHHGRVSASDILSLVSNTIPIDASVKS